MIHRDRHDQRYGGLLDDVGGIEASTEAHFHHAGIRRMGGKQQETDSRENLKDRDRLTGIGIGNAADGLGESFVIDEFTTLSPAHPVALVPVDQVRRGVDVDGMPRCFKQRTTESRSRTLAVGAGDVNDRRQMILRIMQSGQQG